MEPPSPARLYATLIGAVLFVAGIVGFFHDLSWLNYLYVASGAAACWWPGSPRALCTLRRPDLHRPCDRRLLQPRLAAHLAVGLLGLAAFAASRGSQSTDDVGRAEPRSG